MYQGFFKPFALERFFAKWEFEAKWLLCSSDCESVSVSEICSLERDSERQLMNLHLGYTESRGAPDLRNAIAGRYNRIAADGIIVHAGAEEAILNLCLAILEPGHKVIVNFPCYQSLAEIPRALGCEVIPWPAREMDGPNKKRRWFFDPDELATLIDDKTKLVILNAPHNPTGALPTPAEFSAIIDKVRASGAILFVDEVYRNLEHIPSRRLPSVADAYENGIALDVLSKSAGLAGLRIGWLASGRTDILDAVAQVKDYNTICSSGPSEVIAGIALRNLDVLVSRNRGIVDKNMTLLRDFFRRRSAFASWTEPEGGSIAFPYLADGADAETLAEKLVRDSGVLLLPAAFYNYEKRYFRIGYGRANMPEALKKLEDWLDGI